MIRINNAFSTPLSRLGRTCKECISVWLGRLWCLIKCKTLKLLRVDRVAREAIVEVNHSALRTYHFKGIGELPDFSLEASKGASVEQIKKLIAQKHKVSVERILLVPASLCFNFQTTTEAADIENFKVFISPENSAEDVLRIASSAMLPSQIKFRFKTPKGVLECIDIRRDITLDALKEKIAEEITWPQDQGYLAYRINIIYNKFLIRGDLPLQDCLSEAYFKEGIFKVTIATVKTYPRAYSHRLRGTKAFKG